MPRGGSRPNTGGHREGAGRKRTASKWSDAFKRDLIRAVTKKKRETGKSAAEVLVEILYADYQKAQHRVAVFKAISDALVERGSHKTVEEHKYSYAPVLLPVQDDDPAGMRVEETKH